MILMPSFILLPSRMSTVRFLDLVLSFKQISLARSHFSKQFEKFGWGNSRPIPQLSGSITYPRMRFLVHWHPASQLSKKSPLIAPIHLMQLPKLAATIGCAPTHTPTAYLWPLPIALIITVPTNFPKNSFRSWSWMHWKGSRCQFMAMAGKFAIGCS